MKYNKNTIMGGFFTFASILAIVFQLRLIEIAVGEIPRIFVYTVSASMCVAYTAGFYSGGDVMNRILAKRGMIKSPDNIGGK